MSYNDVSYNVITDPSGALLQDIDKIMYRNTSVNLIPVYTYTYQLRDSVGNVVADNFYPFKSPVAYTPRFPYLARDASNNIYTTTGSSLGSAVFKLVNSAFVALDIIIPNTFFSFPQLSPRGIAFDSSGVLYITASGTGNFPEPAYPYISPVYSKVFKVIFTDTSTTLTQFNISNVTFNELIGLDFDSSGNLYIADKQNNQIIKVTMVDYNNGIGSVFIPNYTGLNGPVDIKFDPYNNAYIANYNENNIIKVSSAGIVSVFATSVSTPAEITYNLVDGALYITNYSTDGVTPPNVYRVVNGIVSNESSVSGSNSPYGIVSTTTGDIYYASEDPTNTSAINPRYILYKITQDNESTNYANYVTISSTDYSISPVTSLAFDSGGNLYASQYNFLDYPTIYGNIWQISNVSPYNPVLFYPTLGPGQPAPGQPNLNNPTSIAFNILQTYLYVANAATNEIIAISMTSPPVGAIVTITAGAGAALSSPSAIVFDGTGRLYVANAISNTICILTFSTATAATSALYAISGSPILTPAGLAFDSTYSNLYISNPGYNNILKVPLSTNVASPYNLYGVIIDSPAGIYYNDSTGIIYVSDLTTSNIIQITNNNFASIVDVILGESIQPTAPPLPLQIKMPLGITKDAASNNLYISNYGDPFDSIIKLNIDTSTNAVTSSTQIEFGFLGYFYTDTTMRDDNQNIYINNYPPNYTIVSLDPSGVLSTYVNLTPDQCVSLTINNLSDRLYTLISDGSVKSVNSNGVISTFTISGFTPTANARCIRFKSTTTPPYLLYIADTYASPPGIIKVTIDIPATAGTGTNLSITNFPSGFQPMRLAFDSSNNMYMSGGTFAVTNPSKSVYKINLDTLVATLYITIPDLGTEGIFGIAIDSRNYLYSIGIFAGSIKSQLYRTTPDGLTTELVYTFPDAGGVFLDSVNYVPWEDALIMVDAFNNKLYKVYLSYIFTNMEGRVGPYEDPLFIFDITEGANIFDVSFNVYRPYIVIDPSNIAPDVPTNTTFHFVAPNVVPYPTDSYILQCNGTNVSDVFCNNCTYNKQKFLAGTYPTGLVYSTDTNYLYVALQNNTISRVSPLGVVENNYFPPNLGLVGPTSLVLDASFDMFVLNAGGGFISYLRLRNNIISINNSFFTNIFVPICLTYDIETDSLYLLSGAVPNLRITRINARTGAGFILPIAFGVLYDSNGLTIDAYNGLFAPINNQPPNTKYLYVSNTDQNLVNGILRVNLSTLNYEVTSLITGLIYKPFTMTNKNDGFLYVANKNNNSLSKISITGLDPNTQPWASNSISVPVGVGFDEFGNLYVANAGTSPRNSRVSKIYVDEFFFTNVTLPTGTCANTKIYDITTQSYVEIGYYPPPNNYIFPIPVPYPIGS